MPNSSGTIRQLLATSTRSSFPAASPMATICGAALSPSSHRSWRPCASSLRMAAVRKFAADGGLVLGICNGFQILVEAGLLPGALMRNRNLKFICREVRLRTETLDSPFTAAAGVPSGPGQILRMPIAHGEGRYVADERTLDELEAEDRVAFRYLANPNASMRDIAGILNARRNVLGLMPHPERATEPLMGSSDGLVVFRSMVMAAQPVALQL